ncbi:palmitoleoyl-protein carboxylesterase NOTUM-like isoform X2 [Ruditapes philippinarum]|uniref:palmitoleoyl-protein carboxylesterase NOTUM-like isoform X2 n=1 Tax=Ruditapes philippinarum TaxID=129788 RepID=UPI00295B04FE|nr:palmitoleoyl-protein carboxylesterase NOTUM-like isoform X2 [Ruditapes philippinarum]
MTVVVLLLWIYGACVTVMAFSYSNNDHRASNDISLDFEHLERLGQTDSLIKALKDIARSSHDCGVRDVPKLRRKFLTNDSVTCNDGSPAGYFIRKSYGSKKWIIFLEGGWYCFDNVSCQMRWASNMKKFMSSKGWPKKRKVTGILSWNPEENPYYFHSNIVYIPYCSSDTWSGTASMGTNGNEFAFMGSLILEEVIKDLIPRGLKHATKLILTGSSAGGTGVLINLDRVANQMAKLAPEVEVRGIADSGWFLDYPQYRYKDCVEALSCAPTDGIKRGIKMWNGRVPETCMEEYTESEHWRCYFGYRLYKTLKNPLYVIQHLFDEAQILVDNVFEQTQIKGDNSAATVTKPQWEYLHKLGQEVRKTLENVSAVFAPSCLSHEILTRYDWFNVSINSIKLGQSIYCWENSYKYDKCLIKTASVNALDTLQGDSPKTNDSKATRRRRKNRKNKKKKKKKRDRERKRDNRANSKSRKGRNKKRRRRKSRHRRHQHPSGSCFHHLIDSCPLPQCNASCPKYRNRFTGDEMDFFRMFIRYGIDKKDIASLLGKDVSVIQRMDDSTLTRLIMDFVGRGS